MKEGVLSFPRPSMELTNQDLLLHTIIVMKNIYIESMYLCHVQILSSSVNAALRDYWKSSALFMSRYQQQTCYSVAQVNHKLACIHMALT